MLPNLREHLLHKKTDQVPALAKGYRRFKVKGRTYPGLIAGANHEVRGVLIYPLGSDDLEKLDEYEGLEYTRETIDVLNEKLNELEQVQVYLYRKTYSHNITDQNWDLSQLDIKADQLI